LKFEGATRTVVCLDGEAALYLLRAPPGKKKKAERPAS
jgi:hypothetical protein